VNTSEEVLADDELAEESSVSDPHAASVTTRDAAQAAMATEEDPREMFTVATVQPRRTGRFRQGEPGIEG
jgi:hypothetical protein